MTSIETIKTEARSERPTELWKQLLIGFLWGTVVSVVNHLYVLWVIKRNEDLPPYQAMTALINSYGIRYIIVMIALYAVHRYGWMVAAAGVGMTTMKNVVAVKNFVRDWKRVRVSRSGEEGYQALERLARKNGGLLR